MKVKTQTIGPSVPPAERGLEGYKAFSAEDSHMVVESMKQEGIEYWDRLLPDRPLYQVFIKEPNGFVIELNDYTPALDKISPIIVYNDYARDPILLGYPHNVRFPPPLD